MRRFQTISEFSHSLAIAGFQYLHKPWLNTRLLRPYPPAYHVRLHRHASLTVGYEGPGAPTGLADRVKHLDVLVEAQPA